MIDCTYCGKPISSRDVCYSGARNGERYNVHPSCFAEFNKKQGAK